MRQLELINPGKPCPSDIVQPLTGFIQFAEFTEGDGIDLRRYIMGEREHSTFIYRAEGDDMNASGVFTGDLLVADRSMKPQTGNLVVIRTEEGFALRHIVVTAGGGMHLFKHVIRDVDKILCREEPLECYGVVRRTIHPTA